MKLNIKSLIYFSLFFVPYIHFLGVESFPTWRFFNILFVIFSLIYFQKIKKENIPYDFVFLFSLFLLVVLSQFVYLIVDDRIGIYEPMYFISLLFLFGFAFFLFVLLNEETNKTIKVILYSISFMVIYQIFQFSVFMLGYPKLAVILNQVDIEKITVFYKIVGSLFGPPGFLSESGMVSLFLGPIFGILLIYERYNIFKIPKFFLLIILIGILITLSGGAFIEFIFITILILTLNIKKISLKQYLIIACAFSAVGWLFVNNSGYYVLISERIETLLSGRSGRLEGASQIIDIFLDNNIYLGIAPKSGRYFEADQNMLLPMLLTDHGLIGTFVMALIFLLPYITALIHKKRILILIPYTGFLIHLFLAYGTFMWSYLWIVYILVLFGLTFKPESKK